LYGLQIGAYALDGAGSWISTVSEVENEAWVPYRVATKNGWEQLHSDAETSPLL